MPTPTQKKKHRHAAIKGPHGGIQLLLVEEVPHLGKTGDVVEVKAGYARNYLLPRGLATLVSDHNLRLLDRHKQRIQQAQEARLADLRVLAGQIQRATVTIEAKANEEGHLYGSVGAPEIARGLKAMNLNIDPEAVRLEGVIKEANAAYEVKIHLAPEVETVVKVVVLGVAEKK
jgi:large subunit ribosomal protein L9